jgi:ubiquinone/menaquinone biosynthesis C-methylase UbiE
VNFVRWVDEKFYPNHQNNWDDEIFREKILAVLTPGMTILDLGAGAGRVAQMNFKGLARKVIGVDLDTRVAQNPFLDRAHVAAADRLPLEDGACDLVFSDNVLEHLDNPTTVFREIARVLKPGGIFLAKTPNKVHYMPMIATMTPLWFHRVVNRMRGRHVSDTFATRYRVNTPAAIKRFASEAGLDISGIQLIEGRPEYLRFSIVTYVFGMLYERCVNLSEAFGRLRILMIAELRKPT